MVVQHTNAIGRGVEGANITSRLIRGMRDRSSVSDIRPVERMGTTHILEDLHYACLHFTWFLR